MRCRCSGRCMFPQIGQPPFLCPPSVCDERALAGSLPSMWWPCPNAPRHTAGHWTQFLPAALLPRFLTSQRRLARPAGFACSLSLAGKHAAQHSRGPSNRYPRKGKVHSHLTRVGSRGMRTSTLEEETRPGQRCNGNGSPGHRTGQTNSGCLAAAPVLATCTGPHRAGPVQEPNRACDIVPVLGGRQGTPRGGGGAHLRQPEEASSFVAGPLKRPAGSARGHPGRRKAVVSIKGGRKCFGRPDVRPNGAATGGENTTARLLLNTMRQVRVANQECAAPR